MRKVIVGGFQTVSCTRHELALAMLRDCLEARERGDAWTPKLVYSSNGQGIALAGRSKEFGAIMARADLIHADGMPVVVASRFTDAPLPERIATTDFFHDAVAVAIANGLRFFMLGASEEQNRRAVEALRLAYPELIVAGRHHGYFDSTQDGNVCAQIRASGADVVWAALGKPRQEYWCARNRENLGGVGWLKTCGGLYSFLAGDAPRAPQWMQGAGLEWAYRLANDPVRLSWRYLWTNPYAVYRLIRYTRSRGEELN